MKKRKSPLYRSPIALTAMAGILCAVVVLAAWLSPKNSHQTDRKLFISEILSSNASYPDPLGVCADWIEIGNGGDTEEDLSGLILTDDKDQAKYVFPSHTVLAAGEYLVVYCLSSTEPSSYANFGLASSGGETVTLLTEKGQIISQASTFSLKRDQSMAFDSGRWDFCDQPSPGFENTPEGHQKALAKQTGREDLRSPLTLAITEAVTANRGGLKDADGETSDWFEITNVGDAPVALEGLGLSTSPGDPFAFRMETKGDLAPGESLVLFASAKSRNGNGELHTTFRLSAEGEVLYLFDRQGLTVDRCEIPALEEDEAWQKNGDSFFKTFAATPGQNGAMSQADLQRFDNKLVINELCPSFSVGRGGAFDSQSDWLEIKNISQETLDLTGLFLSDNERKQGVPLTGQLAPGEIRLLFADGGEDEGHCEFSLSSQGETVTLYSPWKTVVCQVKYPSLEDNVSYARNDKGEFQSSFHPTPGLDNTLSGLEAYYAALPQATGLVINEVMTQNFSLLPQSYGETYDWIEITNRSDATLSLLGYSLSQERDRPGVFVFGDLSLAPGASVVVFASGEEQLSGKTALHTPFKLSSGGESLFLFAPDGSLCDALSFGPLPVGGSYGREAGRAGWSYFETPTPGKANSQGKRLVASAPVSHTPVGSHEGVSQVEVKLSGEGTVYYTLDGSLPTPSSLVYRDSFFVSRTTVVRAYCSAKGKVDSPVKSYTYLVNEGHELPVVSVSTAPGNLFDPDTGIYVLGPNAAPESPYRGANFYQDWEKAANVSFYDPQGEGFSVDCGLKIFGNTGRALDKKSFQLKFKSQYGSAKLCYNLFENTGVNVFDSLVLRSGSQDYLSSLLRDAVVSELCSQGMPQTEAQDYRYCVLYLNGEYWGVYCLREKLDEDFVAAHYCVDPDSVNVLGYRGTREHGSNRDYQDLMAYVRTHDLSVEEYYSHVKEKISLESYVDWFIAQAYVGNSDLDNIRVFSSTDGDGKWRWILYDFDLTFYRSANPYSYLISPTAYYSDVSELMRQLMKNHTFRDFFLRRIAQQLATTFSEDKVLQVIDTLQQEIQREMPRERARWNLSYSSWENAVKKLKTFVAGGDGRGRTQEIIDDVCKTLNLTGEERKQYFG